MPRQDSATTLPARPPDFKQHLIEHIHAYERLGWQLAPLRTYVSSGETSIVKQHPPKGWPVRRGSVLNELFDGSNRLTYGVALVLGPSGVVDIDLDSDAARALAPKFLRPTATFGRKGRVTHYVYRTQPVAHPDNGGTSKQAKKRVLGNPFDGEKSTILELRRGPGAQTTPPPTIKPDGHPALWTPGWEAALATWGPGDEERVEDLAIAALIASDDPNGARHDSALQWAGELAQRGIGQGRAERIILAACEHRGDADIVDRESVIENTYAKQDEGENIRGLSDTAARKALDGFLGRTLGKSGPPIYVDGELSDCIDQIAAACREADPPRLFRQGNAVVTTEGAATHDRVAVEADRIMTFVRRNKDGDPYSVHPPGELMKRFTASVPDLPELLGRWRVPILRPDGTIFAERGYDPVTKLWCDGWSGPSLDGRSREFAAVCASAVLNFVHAGQWEEPIDMLCWLAHVLTIAARPAIAGPVPAWIYTSPLPGSGKTTLAQVAGVIGGGCAGFTDPSVKNEEELARRLDKHALSPAVVLDNARGVFKSPVLEAATTGGMLAVRRLHVGPAEVPWRTVLSVTSNGAEIGRDWARRSLPVRLNGQRLAEDRDVRSEAEQRPELTACALAIVSSWLQSGQPYRGQTLASFGEWSRIVNGALSWIGFPDVVAETREAASDLVSVGDDQGEMLDMIEAWTAQTGKEEFTSRDLWEAPTLYRLQERFRDYRQFSSTLGRCGDATRVVAKRRSCGQRWFRIEARG